MSKDESAIAQSKSANKSFNMMKLICELKKKFFSSEPSISLRHLLYYNGNYLENDKVEAICCTMNRLLFFYLLIKWINFEVWWYVGDGNVSVR